METGPLPDKPFQVFKLKMPLLNLQLYLGEPRSDQSGIWHCQYRGQQPHGFQYLREQVSTRRQGKLSVPGSVRSVYWDARAI